MVNHKIFEQTALPHSVNLFTYALYLTRNSENAKDLLQDTYFKACRFWCQFEDGTNIKAWLRRIMKNSYINIYRKGINKPVNVEYQECQLPDRTMEEASFDQEDLTKKTYEEIFDDEITLSLESLDGSFRDVIVLRDVKGRTYEEIARTINCPVGTVRSRLSRGRRQLKEKLFDYARNAGYVKKCSRE